MLAWTRKEDATSLDARFPPVRSPLLKVVLKAQHFADVKRNSRFCQHKILPRGGSDTLFCCDPHLCSRKHQDNCWHSIWSTGASQTPRVSVHSLHLSNTQTETSQKQKEGAPSLLCFCWRQLPKANSPLAAVQNSLFYFIHLILLKIRKTRRLSWPCCSHW